nr:probable ATP-dependent DNA helicase CHR12 [Tanacetum cinerariifolium]
MVLHKVLIPVCMEDKYDIIFNHGTHQVPRPIGWQANHFLHIYRRNCDWNNPQMDQQAEDRAYRIGQKKEVRVFVLARSEEEFWLFEKMDDERRQKKGYRSRLMEDHEVPDWAYSKPDNPKDIRGKGFDYETANLRRALGLRIVGSGKRPNPELVKQRQEEMRRRFLTNGGPLPGSIDWVLASKGFRPERKSGYKSINTGEASCAVVYAATPVKVTYKPAPPRRKKNADAGIDWPPHWERPTSAGTTSHGEGGACVPNKDLDELSETMVGKLNLKDAH